MARGRYHDGKTARQRDVALTLTGTALLIAGEDGGDEVLASWPLSELRRIDQDGPEGRVRFKRGEAGDERLTVDDAAFAAALTAAVPRTKRRSGWNRWLLSAGGCGVLLLFLFFAVPQLSAVVAPMVPVGWERKIADASTNIFLGAFGGGEFCSGPEGLAALDSLSARLTDSVESDYDIRIRVSSHEMVNAFAMLGGDVVVFHGLIEFAESPDEVAAVVAHELGHLIRRHPTQALVRALSLDLFMDFLTGGSALSGIGQTMVALSYSRDAEREADALGLRLLRDAGLRRDGMASFFRRLEEKHGGLPESLRYLSTHPTVGERVENARTDSEGASAMTPAAWDALRRICD